MFIFTRYHPKTRSRYIWIKQRKTFFTDSPAYLILIIAIISTDKNFVEQHRTTGLVYY